MTADPGDPGGHLSAERLAAAALGALGEGTSGTDERPEGSDDGADSHPPAELAELSPAERDHVATCAVCRYELDALVRVVSLGTGGGQALTELTEPRPELWSRIAAGISGPPALAPATEVGVRPRATSPVSPLRPAPTPVGPVPPATPADVPSTAAGSTPRRSVRRRSRAAIALVAAAVGLVVGVGGTVAIRQATAPAGQVVASTALTALPGEQGRGTAELVRTDGILDLRVSVDASVTPDRFYQLWLLDSAGDRMYDLGTLPPNGAAASYPLPAELAQGLGSYTVVDVSIEPYDGNPAHSHHSLVRGQLPG